ncbi:MAG: tetratricopeptide repeat protein [Thermomicrobiales bacterium]
MDEALLNRNQRVHLTCLERESDFAAKLVETLADVGIEVTTTAVSDDFDQDESQISLDFRDAAALILLCTDTSLRDRRIRQHLHLAWRYDRPIIPVLVTPLLVPDEAAYWLEGSQWIEAFDRENDWQDDLFAALINLGLRPAGIDPARIRKAGRRASVNLPHTRVPSPSAKLVGRKEALAELERLLSQHKLVTVSGPGGAGKSRLAIEVARQVRPLFPDGVFFIELVVVRDSEMVPETVARSLGVEAYSAETMNDAILRGLADRRLMLVLDNFEQVMPAAPFVAQLLRHCPGVSVMITSRAPTGIAGEIVFDLGPLDLPDPSADADQLPLNESIQLFVERAHDANPSFELTPENAADVAALCIALDGLPLSLELVAGKSRVLTPAQMLERYTGSTNLLSVEGNVGGPDHQRSLRRTIEWSVELLSNDHRRVLGWLGVFAGGATFDAIESLFERLTFPNLPDALEAVDSLVQQHLLTRVERPRGEPRFGMLESIRVFAREALDNGDDAEEVRRAHATLYLDLLADAGSGLTGPDQASWLHRLSDDYDNCRAAVEWAFETEPQLLAGALTGLWHFWSKKGGLQEGVSWLDGLALDANDTHMAVTASLMNLLGNMAIELGDSNRARSCFSRCQELAQALDDPARQADAVLGLGLAERTAGDYTSARQHLELALSAARTLGPPEFAAVCLDCIADTWVAEGRYDTALPLHQEALDILARTGDTGAIAYSYYRLGLVAHRTQRGEAASEYLSHALSLFNDSNDVIGAAYAQLELSQVQWASGNRDGALGLLRQVIAVATRERLTLQIIETIERTVVAGYTGNDNWTAIVLLSLCNHQREILSCPAAPVEARELSKCLEAFKSSVGTVSFEAAWQKGQRIDLVVGAQLVQKLIENGDF